MKKKTLNELLIAAKQALPFASEKERKEAFIIFSDLLKKLKSE